MNRRKSVKGCSVWFLSGRFDTKLLAEWFDVRIFNPFCTVWNVFVIQDESDLVKLLILSSSILADKKNRITNLTFQVLGDQALLGSIDGIS